MEGILDHLTKIPELTVISRSSVEQYRDNRSTSPEIANKLNVEFLVEGSVQRVGDEAVIFAQLIHANSDKHLWSKRYDRNLKDIFAIQAEITQSIADELQAIITPDVKERIETPPTTNMESYELYIRGNKYLNDYRLGHDEADLTIAEKFYEEALLIDSTFADVYVSLGWINAYRSGITEIIFYDFLALVSNESKDYLIKMEQYAQKALTLDPTLAFAYLLRGWYNQGIGEYDKMKNDLGKALSLNPNMSDAYFCLAWLSYANENEIIGGIVNFKKALTLEGDGPFKSELLRSLGADL